MREALGGIGSTDVSEDGSARAPKALSWVEQLDPSVSVVSLTLIGDEGEKERQKT